MARQTAFPGIYLEDIKVQKPPFDEPGMVQEFVGRGATKSLEVPQNVNNMREEYIQDSIRSMQDIIGPIRGDYEITYTLLVKGKLDRGISARARAFARAKNPFEPNLINVSDPHDAGEFGPLDVKRVSVRVRK